MIDSEKLGRINAALGYWVMIDFLTQSTVPEVNAHAKVTCRKNCEDGRSPISVSHRFQSDLDCGASGTMLDMVDSNIAGACQEHARFLRKAGAKTDKDAEDLKQLTTAINKHAFPPAVSMDIFLGIIPKEPVIAALEGKLPSVFGPSKRSEIETDELVSALVHLDGTGAITQVEISPAIWLISKSAIDASNLFEAFENEAKQFSKTILERFADRVVTPHDLRSIADSLLPRPLIERIDAFLEGHPSYGTEYELGRTYRNLVSYQAFDNPAREPHSASLHSSFYAKDIKALHDALNSGQGDVDALSRGQLKLALSYLEGGLDHHDERDASRLDIQSAATELDRDKVALFYHHALSLDNTPLGRWPSKYSLSLMQQVAVNMVAGRNISGPSTATDVPVSDVMSVNGPPGTGKTTLLKDIIAANIVEKARLLAEYDKPDDAFSHIEGVDKYVNQVKRAYRLKDPKIADLGIIVCSSNNTAVENISEELPKGRALLDDLEDEAKDRFRERAMFRGETENDKSLFQMAWRADNSQQSPTPKRDLYFSRIACDQFEKPKESDASFDLLISARLGKKENIDKFRDSTLDTIAYETNVKSRKAHLERFKISKQAFLNQYDRVESLLKVYSEAQRDVLECHKAKNEARRECDRAEAARKNAERTAQKAREEMREALDRTVKHLQNREKLERALGERGESLGRIESFGELRDLEDQIRDGIAEYTGELKTLEGNLESARSEREDPSFFDAHFRKKMLDRAVNEAEGKLAAFRERNRANERLASLAHAIAEERKELGALEQNAIQAENKAREAANEADRAQGALDRAIGQLNRARTSCPWELAPEQLQSLTTEDSDQSAVRTVHLFNPLAKTPDENSLRYERDKLFLRALQVTRDFILASASMASNLKLLKAYWGASTEKADGTGYGRITFSDQDARVIVPALFQTLSILTPVISTTFASAGRLLRDIPIANDWHAPLGLCIIDEAGQAVPQAAVGVLARCNKALVVGDPYQIEPVVDSEVKLFTKTLGRNIDFPFKSCTSSVQALADTANPIGCYRNGDDDEPEWIGCPLVVHRRCVSPMFEISNEISYENSMLNETAKLDPEKDKEKLASFYLPSSQWINVAGSERGNGDHYVAEQGKRAGEVVASAFTKKPLDAAVPSLYIISPFSTVVRGVRGALEAHRPKGVDDDTWKSFLKNNVGTVHKFQGKEAQEVIFMLGCDRTSIGAVKWVNPNIVNVAASRARQRLYVIADYNVWKENRFVSTMKRIIDTAWVELWRESKANGGKGIDEVRRAIPHLESLPTINLPSSESVVGTPGSIAPIDYENRQFSTDNFLENVRPLLEYRDLGKSVCKRFGFENEKELDSAFATCADPDNPSSNRVLSNIKMGMLLYDLFDIDHRSSGEDQEDWSFCAIMFCRAAELFLQLKLLPSLKEINPKLAVGGKQTIAERKELSLGQYYHALCDKGAQTTCGMAAGYRCRSDVSETGPISSDTTPQDPAWWESFGKNLKKLAGTRNDFCHAGRSTTPDINKLLARLFSGHIKQEDQGAHVALLCEGRTLEIAKEGIGSQSFARTMQELAKTNFKTPEQTADSRTPRQEQSATTTIVDNQKAIAESENRIEQTPARLTQSTDMASHSESSADRIPASDQHHRFEGEYHSISQWKTNCLKDELDNYPGLSDGATKINQVLEREDYISYKPTRFTQKALDSWDVQEREGHNKDGTTFMYPVYSYSALIKALKVYNANKDKTES